MKITSPQLAPYRALLAIALLLAAAFSLLTAGDSAHAQTAVPAAPTGLTAPTVVHNSVTLSWDDPGDTSITGYRILRRDPVNQAPGVFSTIVSNTGSAATSYTDGTVAAKTRYVYRVKAINAAGLSGQSNYVNAETPAAPVSPSAPAAPTGLTAETIAHDSVTLTWVDPDEGDIISYQVLRRSRDGDDYGDGQGAAQFVVIMDDTGTSDASYTDTSVTARTRYVYRVKAINSVGLSEQSSYLNVETLAEPVTTTVVVVPPEEPEEPEVALQQQVTIIDRGTLTVDPRLPTRGTIGSPGERHRYEVELQANRFYDLYIREGSTGEIRLLDQLGDPVQYDGRDLVSAPHAAWSGGYLFYQPTTGSTYVVEVRARDDQQTGFYALMVRDGTITASSGDEGRSSSTDFKQFINRAKLHPDDPVSGIIDTNGDIHGTLVDEDFFEANLHAGRTYTFTFAAGRITGGQNRKLWIAVHGPGTYHNFNNFSPPTSWAGSRTLSITITPHRTGPYVFTIGVFDSVIDRTAGTYVVLNAAITPYTVTLTEQ